MRKFRKNQIVHFHHFYDAENWPCNTGTVIGKDGDDIIIKSDSGAEIRVWSEDVDDLLEYEWRLNRYIAKGFKSPFFIGCGLKFWFELIKDKVINVLTEKVI